MLQYMGAHQIPRKYPIPTQISSDTLSESSLCHCCTSNVWTEDLFSALRAAPSSESQFKISYEVSSSTLRDSVIEGCKWCRTLADGIHGRIFLDTLYERFEKTESWPSEGSDGSNNSCRGRDFEDEEEGDEWNTAEAFNDDNNNDVGDEDATGRWDLYEDRDMLAEECAFIIDVTFLRNNNGAFAFLNAHVESVDTLKGEEEASVVQKVRGEKAVDLRYHVRLSGIDELQNEPFPPTTSDTVLGADSNIQMIQEWLENSDRSNKPSNVNSLTIPARLIDISDGLLRIVDTSSIFCPESERTRGFAALSYVWGTSQTFVLLESTKVELLSSFDIRKLPQTIQDAITVTRKLGFRYLWVDALCIQQDSPSDKAIELPKMRQIYQRASITIVAAVAKTATEGFLHICTETSYFIHPITIPYCPASSSPETSLVLSYPAGYLRQKDPINDRAWTFQEWVLPTRLVSFSYRGIQMIDRKNIPDADGLTSGKDVQLPDLPWHGSLYTLDPDPENLRQRWLSTRDEYTNRQLTYSGDKLVAIAAVAEEFGRSYGCKYLAGLWERDLAIDLQWERVATSTLQTRAKGYVAPSWSWASMSGEIGDRASDVEIEGFGMEVVGWEVEYTLPGFMYGAVTSGSLVLKGRVRSFFWRAETKEELQPLDGHLAVRGESDPHPEVGFGEVVLDALDEELVDGCVVDCLAMSVVENAPGREDVEGIVLLPADDHRHRRVGYFKEVSKLLWDDVELIKITII